MTYHSANNRYADLATLGTANFLNDTLIVAGDKSRYHFTLTVDAAQPDLNFQATAAPTLLPVHWRHFFVDATGVIRFNTTGAANASSSPIN